MTASTSPKPPTTADPNDLRTALTKAIDRVDPPGGMRADTPSISVAVLRTLLDAHPAQTPVPSGHDIACDADYLNASCICDEITPEPAEARCLADTSWEHHDRTDDFPCSSCVSDTRREDVGLGLIEAHVAEFEASIARLEASIQDPNNTVGGREYDTAKLHGQRGAVYALRRLADVLAVLPAPPAVDEAEIATLIRSHNAAPADELEARIGLKNGCTCGESGMAIDHQAADVAARLRGATRG